MLPADSNKIEKYLQCLREQKIGDNNPAKRKDVRDKMSAAKKGKSQKIEHVKARIDGMRKAAEKRGYWHSEKTRKNIGLGNKDKIRTDATLQKLSEGQIRMLMNTGNSNYCYGKQGWFYSVKNNQLMHYRSSWELKYYQQLESEEDVIKYESEPFAIKYSLNTKIHNYLPDVLIHYNDGLQRLVEIKPTFKLKEETTQIKLRAAEEYCNNNHIIFSVITEEYFERD